MTPAVPGVVLFDGVCGLCHGLVQFLIRRDRHDRLRFAPLQGPYAAAVLQRHGKSAVDLDTVYLVQRPGSATERLTERSDAVLAALAELGGLWRGATVLRIFPRFVRNKVYAMVARSRYRLFGRLDACPLPTPAQRAKFMD